MRPGPGSWGMAMSGDTFNAADYFVDRHLREGRHDAIAIECEDRLVSYATLADRVKTSRADRLV